jgi:hypothetical protein
LVRSKAAAERLIAAVRDLERKDVKISGERPESYQPTAAASGMEAWVVTLVALEMVGRMRLVEVRATVHSTGKLEIESRPVVDGPQLTWQTGASTEASPEKLESERRKRVEAQIALIRCGQALELEPSIDSTWVLGRVLSRMYQIREMIGEPDRNWGKTHKMWQYILPDQSTITFGCKRVEGKEGDMERIEYVGRIWSEREGTVRVTMTQNYFSR